MTDKITSLGTERALKNHDNRAWSPVECLQNLIDDINSGEIKVDKLIVVRVSAEDDEFNVGYHLCNMRSTEVMAALEIAKIMALQDMNYLAQT